MNGKRRLTIAGVMLATTLSLHAQIGGGAAQKDDPLTPLLQSPRLTLTLAPADSEPGGGGEAGMTDEKAQEAELVKKTLNPIANLVSVPIQNNWDFGIGPADAMKFTANVQPVIPFSLNRDWNLISRTIAPLIYAQSPVEGGGDHSGLGDITESLFFSPKEPVCGWILGGGPVFLLPSATDSTLGSGKWGAGPTFVALQQKKGWTYGMLVNHI